MTHEIKYPTTPTYFIAYTDTSKCAYGLIQSNQQMDTGQPQLWTSFDQAEWLEELKDVFNVVPEPPY